MRTVCGSEIVTEDTRGMLVYALMTLKNLSAEKKEFLQNKWNIKVGNLLGSSSLRFEYKNFLQIATAVSSLKIRMFALGGGGMKDISHLINDKIGFAYSHIPLALKDYISSATAKNSVPWKFHSVPIQAFLKSDYDKIEKIKRRQISEIYHRYMTLKIY